MSSATPGGKRPQAFAFGSGKTFPHQLNFWQEKRNGECIWYRLAGFKLARGAEQAAAHRPSTSGTGITCKTSQPQPAKTRHGRRRGPTGDQLTSSASGTLELPHNEPAIVVGVASLIGEGGASTLARIASDSQRRRLCAEMR